MPVIQVPAFAGPNDMPVGVSLVTRRHGDQYLLRVAKILSGPLMSNGSWQQQLGPSERDFASGSANIEQDLRLKIGS